FKELIDEGLIRHVGLSNENPWGAMKYAELADRGLGPRMASVQNPYNLLNRLYEVGMAEVSIREDMGLLAYSPLAFGVLSGKYRGGAKPAGARLTLYPYFGRYTSPRGIEATERYLALADELGIAPEVMALKFVDLQPFVTATIIGATTEEQLIRNIEAFDATLPEGALDGIQAIYKDIPDPSP
ncbi:MAG: aldo/keto reductase, partial [Rhodospirillales bacterium]